MSKKKIENIGLSNKEKELIQMLNHPEFTVEYIDDWVKIPRKLLMKMQLLHFIKAELKVIWPLYSSLNSLILLAGCMKVTPIFADRKILSASLRRMRMNGRMYIEALILTY